MRQLEEGTGHAAHLVDLRLGHAVARDHEEADLAAGGVHLGGDPRLVFRTARKKRRDIDDRDQGLCHRQRSTKCPSVRDFSSRSASHASGPLDAAGIVPRFSGRIRAPSRNMRRGVRLGSRRAPAEWKPC